ncbi:MAG: polysaccharide deacetylase family protein [Bacteroidales bacterium]|jgi:peptidoglycan/xylan/chitin deacetylase (PgdA/CDA1 family)|nr:polysaccharide deacetylase family protein [Bacteroidales bacterium]
MEKPHKITILCLHKITDEIFPSWSGMPLKTFEKLLKFVNKHYEIVLPDKIENKKTKKPCLILTFDDGFEDFYINAFPLLQKYKTPAVLNIVVESIINEHQIWTQRLNDIIDSYEKNKQIIEIKTKNFNYSGIITKETAAQKALDLFLNLLHENLDYINEILFQLENKLEGSPIKTKMMSVNQLKEVANSNSIEIGSHTMTHLNLKSIQNNDILDFEITKSKKILEEITAKTVNIFAYPNGMYSDNDLEIVKKAGYKYILLVNNQRAEYYQNGEIKILDRILIYSNKHYKNLYRLFNLHNYIKR